MTIETTTNRISYTGSGTTGPFSFPYYFLADGDLTVIKTTIADGTEETLTLTTDYTVSGAGEAAGGSVTLVATLTSAYKLTIIRDPDILQPADYPPNDRFPAATHEEALDRATMISQRLKDLIDRSFRLSDGDVSGISLVLSNLSAGNLIAVNAAGDGIESIAAADVDLATVSAFILTLLDDANAAAARATLGALASTGGSLSGYLNDARATVASHATTSAIWAAAGNEIDYTGSATVTDFPDADQAGSSRILHCAGTPTFTNNANISVQGGANYTAAAGDVILVHAITTTTFKIEVLNFAEVPGVVPQATAEAGASTTPYKWTPQRVAQAIAALGGNASITLGTPQATTSGTSIDFTGIPSGTKMIVISMAGVSTNGTSIPIIQLGDSGGVETSGYLGSAGQTLSATAALVTDGMAIRNASLAASIMNGSIMLTLENAGSFTWCSQSIIGLSDTAQVYVGGSSKSLSAELDRVRLTTVGGTNTFDAGEINILYFG